MCKSAMYSSQLRSWMTYVEKPGMTAIYRTWSWMAGLIVSATYTHNCGQLSLYRDELVTDDDIFLKGNRIVMPASLHVELYEMYRVPARACSGTESTVALRLLCPSVQLTPWVTNATRDTCTCLADCGYWPICDKPWNISPCVWLLFEVSIRLCDSEPSDKN